MENTSATHPIVPIVIGTAGHIDHGKSTLVQALTGIDPDRLKEEKERGMTIDLGFAPLEMPGGRLVGIVDVPGHERFIRNMVAGATGIDLVILVVAADDGVMPQTREHLQIMQLLGVVRGFVALTKIDMVEEELVDLAEEDVVDNVQGTFLEDAPILRISAKTGLGMEALRTCLFKMVEETTPRSAEGIFRMPVQRVFSKAGFGTVATGIPVSGSAQLGDVLEVLPAATRGKVRGLNAYRRSQQTICAGHSAAINFSDVDHHDLKRGDVIAMPGFFSPQRMVAARLHTLRDLDRPVTNRMQVRLHTGTTDAPGEVILLDKEEIMPGESALLQIRLRTPIICAAGDRFVLRLLSPVVTLGGGALLEESRYRLKRFRDFVLEGLLHQEQSLDSPPAHLESVLARAGDELISTADLMVAIKCSRAETLEFLESLRAEGSILSPKADRWLHADRMEDAVRRALGALEKWLGTHAHRSLMDVRDLRSDTRFEAPFLAVLLNQLVEREQVELLAGGQIRRQGREVVLSDKRRDLARDVEGSYRSARFQPPTPEELCRTYSVGPDLLRETLEYLEDERRLERVGSDMFLSRTVLDEARDAVRQNCEKHGRLEIPDLRDRLQTSRKFLIPILEYFDAQGLTIRQASHRILRR